MGLHMLYDYNGKDYASPGDVLRDLYADQGLADMTVSKPGWDNTGLSYLRDAVNILQRPL